MTKAEIWQQHINAWQASGLSQVDFCRQQNIKQHNLQYWRKRLILCEDNVSTFVPVTFKRPVPVRLILSTQVSVELPSESLPDVLLALRDKGLLYAPT